jgi:carboxyl-terminal processing protease
MNSLLFRHLVSFQAGIDRVSLLPWACTGLTIFHVFIANLRATKSGAQGNYMRAKTLSVPLIHRQSLLCVGLCLAGFFSDLRVGKADDLAAPTRSERSVAKVVARMMKDDHLSNRGLDETISSRAFDQYLKTLDPLKLYFLQSDVEDFEQWRNQIGEQLSVGDYTAALEIYKRFLQRVDENTKLAVELVDAPHDFTVDEEMPTDPDRLTYAKDDNEIREIWRKRIKYNLLVLRGDKQDELKKNEATKGGPQPSPEGDSKSEDSAAKPLAKPMEEPTAILRKRYNSLARRWHQMKTEDVVEMYITSVTSSFDPHTSYFSAGTFQNFLIQMGLQLEGIGATLGATDEGYTVIKAIVPGGAAAKEGSLKLEDKIIAVGQGDEEGQQLDPELARKHGLSFVDAVDMRLDDVVGMIRGKAGTVVRLQVMHENSSETAVIKIVREKIKLEDSAALGQIFEEGTKADGTPRKIGVIDLPSFYSDMGEGGLDSRSTTTDVRKILNKFTAEQVDAVVLDLRRNGGGSLREAIDCTGLFIDYGTVVQVKNSFGRIDKHNDEVRGMAWGGPLVVVTSKMSASASEILAGAVQDYRRGIVVGDSTTHGKGTVQELKNLDQQLFRSNNPARNTLGALKVTTQQFYRPNGESTQKRGVLSDIVLPSIFDKMDISESDLDYAIEFDTVPSARIKSYEMVNETMIETLNQKAMSRIEKDAEFQSWITKIQHYVEQKERKSVSLNESVFMARRAELNSEEEEEKAVDLQINPKREIKADYYLKEVLRIAGDYVEQLNG